MGGASTAADRMRRTGNSSSSTRKLSPSSTSLPQSAFHVERLAFADVVLQRYRAIIVDICQKMQTGMADYTHKAATSKAIYLETIAEYDLYCHYVAGLVGEGLSRLFTASGKESALVGTQLSLSNSMGLLLQKTNIIRDYREDCEDKRYFWPREIWGKYGFKEMHEMYAEDPSTKERAQWVQTHMVLDALRHTIDALDYLKLIKNQSVFNFVAIPATMAIATLELCFMNPTMFERNIKIRKSDAATVSSRTFLGVTISHPSLSAHTPLDKPP